MNIWVDANGWPVPPIVLFGCLAAEILYFRGWYALRQKERTKKAARVVTSPAITGSDTGKYQWNSLSWRSAYFLGAIFTFLLAACAPIDSLSGRLFWVHMVQHLLLLVVMAPLIVASAPLIPLWLGLPAWLRRIAKALVATRVGSVFYRIGYWVGHVLRHPAISCGLLIIGVWVWHWPSLYDLALTNDAIHDWCEHLSFMVVSMLFWTQVIPSPPLYPRMGYIGRMGCVGFAIFQNVVLAALLGFAPAVLYAPYAHLVIGGWLTALQDQQFGAGIMWTFGDVPFGIAFSVLMQRWLASQSDTDQNVTERSAVSAAQEQKV